MKTLKSKIRKMRRKLAAFILPDEPVEGGFVGVCKYRNRTFPICFAVVLTGARSNGDATALEMVSKTTKEWLAKQDFPAIPR